MFTDDSTHDQPTNLPIYATHNQDAAVPALAAEKGDELLRQGCANGEDDDTEEHFGGTEGVGNVGRCVGEDVA
ncbi:hypothetical protein CCUS01_16864 [Colletotrichum cuscutae]|uniref:Uncharacterized protein n=1 Tax=Colletotrichum cuscutae TaxID=1209917 RepID=A0AAI9V8L0_9PEZI|nr:hypothetical protein CCUS01_16864 [Colletotrichum cuscutae]